jgi:acetone carboxylase, alpha subunit
MSHENARDIYRVVYDERTLVVDVEGTRKCREDYRKARIARGKPFDEFCKGWVTAQPPANIPYFGCWDDPTRIYATSGGRRIQMDADKLQGAFMPNPKDVRIAELEAQLARLQPQP